MSSTADRFSSASIHWGTPDHIFEKLERRFKLNLDACAENAEVAKCDRFISPEQDSLSSDQSWEGRVWLNPPYGRGIAKWLEKAQDELENGEAEIVVALLPNSTGTKWFHSFVVPQLSELILLHKRVQFVDIKGTAQGVPAGANFDSIVCVMRPKREIGTPRLSYMEARE